MQSLLRHEVWVLPPGKTERILVNAFEPERWQWALKLVRFLVEKGLKHVELVDVTRQAKENETCQTT